MFFLQECYGYSWSFVFPYVLVFSGCYNKIPQTRQLTKRKLFLLVWDARNPRSESPHGQVRALFHAADFLSYLHVAKSELAPWGLFYKDTNPIHDRCAFMTSQRPPLANTTILGIRLSTYGLREETKIQTITPHKFQNQLIESATVWPIQFLVGMILNHIHQIRGN